MASVCLEELRCGKLTLFAGSTVVTVCMRGDVSRLISVCECVRDREELVFEINISTAPIRWQFLTSLGSLYTDNLFRSILTARRNSVISRKLCWGGGRQVGVIFRERHCTLKCGLGFDGPGVLLRQESQHVSWEQLRPGEREPRLPRGMIAPYSLRWDYDLACESGQLLVQAD
jgi:hypothetical protein